MIMIITRLMAAVSGLPVPNGYLKLAKPDLGCRVLQRFKTFGQFKTRRSFGIILLLLVVARFSTDCRANGEGIVFLRESDPIPPRATLLQELRLSANSYTDSCAWFELLLKGTRIAASSGGNLVKIIQRNQMHDAGCDALQLAIYHVDSPRNADRSFRWSDNRKLRWDDFKGGVRPGATNRIAAETSCGISLETSLAPASARARVYVFNAFDKQQSWVRADEASPAVLDHEQGHWDLCEIYTRRMQIRFNAATISGARLNDMVTRIYDQLEREYLQRQNNYETQTQHGLDAGAQARWDQQIAAELAQK